MSSKDQQINPLLEHPSKCDDIYLSKKKKSSLLPGILKQINIEQKSDQ